ncbi:MAG: hypothetical protein Q8L52_03745 [bacterium]|nr:hypothetical protein [bacterium]
MSVIETYIEYLKDNPEGYWFKRKLYGWGWTPALWQGWAVLAIFLVYVVWVVSGIEHSSDTVPDTEMYWFLGKIAFGAAILIAVCYWKGEKPKWQWGIPLDKQNENAP